jgi:hypothetical protein
VTQLKLNAEKALVFRITHRDNLPWVLDHGLHCARSDVQDPNFVGIGNADLIGMRREHRLPPPCHGTLGDYVPFYFTPCSPMLNNIRTGWGGVTRRERDEIVVLVTSLPRLAELGIDFVFSDRHAYLATARFSSDLADLPSRIPWQQLQARDFKKDPNDPGKFERYQAEALVFQHVPIQALLGIVCHGEAGAAAIRGLLADRGIDLPVHVRPNWYF